MNSQTLVTGLGVVTPIGIEIRSYWDALCERQSNFSAATEMYRSVKEPCVGGFVDPSSWRAIVSYLSEHGVVGSQTPRVLAFAAYATLKALEDAGIPLRSPRLRNAAVVIGNLEPNIDHGDEIDSRSIYPTITSSCLARRIASLVGSDGYAATIHNTCASGNAALEYAKNLIDVGLTEIAIVGSADAFSKRIFAGFNALNVLGPERCRPFSTNRKNITISEGAAVMIVERSSNRVKSTSPYAEVLEVVSNNDAMHPTNPSSEGVLECHRRLLSAKPTDAQVDVIFAHGTGSRANDSVEAGIFAELYPSVIVTAIKGTVGHLMGAAGSIGAVSACLTAATKVVPPTNIDEHEKEYSLRIPVSKERLSDDSKICVQNNSFGFGGTNAISLFRSL